ncbi:protein FAM210B, mitochondrial [Melanotaenia boesemani]|uniref:protein FAM210B, mitochondrial n=1 Tax=Melanotaenia boesemani TaxID=1250792 RepID=UPI001C04167A|nr:protein FAM210B, mitochondrial [Melanotaenia boesemani]
MLLCRLRTASAAALDQGLFFLVRLKANRLKDVTQAACKDHTFKRHRLFCAVVGGVDPNRENLGKQKPDPVQNWDTPCCFVTTEWGHLDRVATVAVNLSRSVQRKGGEFDPIRRFNSKVTADVFSFTGNCGVSSGRCFTTSNMQTRASSTSAATKKSEEQADNKGDVQEASPTSTTEKGLGDTPEPEGVKLNKTQQLKKVFKEYGAVGVSFHIGISLMSLGMFYLLISSGIDMAALLCKLGFSEAMVQSKMAAGTSTFVLAYAIHKLFAPVRISITLVSVPLIVRYFRKTGLFKPPTPAP